MKFGTAILIIVIACLLLGTSPPQKIGIVDGIHVIQNEKGGIFARGLPIALELIQSIGDIDTEDENLAFNLPEDLAVDEAGNIYILDSGNHRVQKFSPALKYLATIGRRGQGPGEFNYPQRLDLDSEGNLYVLDSNQARIQVINPSGKEIKTIRIDLKTLDMDFLQPGRLVITTSLGYEHISKKIRDEGSPKLRSST
jgi:sugar lactone lactonase YvrE